MAEPFVLCGSTCRHNHDSPNGPSGCADAHTSLRERARYVTHWREVPDAD